MKHAFTMIELIFVIVVLGALTAVSVVKLSATRDDAEATSLTSNARTCLSDLKSMRISTGDPVLITASPACQAANNLSANTVTLVVDTLTINGTLDMTLNIAHNLAGTAISR